MAEKSAKLPAVRVKTVNHPHGPTVEKARAIQDDLDKMKAKYGEDFLRMANGGDYLQPDNAGTGPDGNRFPYARACELSD